MSDQIWTLTGVVVGAILGGGSQMVADQLRARREREHTRRSTRHAAYQGFLAAIQHAYSARMRLSFHGTQLSDPEDTDAAAFIRDHSDALVQAHRELDTALAAVKLAGPPAIATQAVEIERYITKTYPLTDDSGLAGLNERIDAFAEAAQEFIGIA